MNTLSNNHLKNKGFTIVELLIVIIVIGILAAIIIVAYNGTTAKAANSQTISALGDYAKALQNYKTTKGNFPIASNVCLAPQPVSGSATCGNVTDATTPCFSGGTAVSSAGFDSAMKNIITTLPVLSPQSMNCNGKMYSGGIYTSADGIATTILYYLKGDVDCPTVGLLTPPTKSQKDDATVCSTSLQ